MILAGSEPVLKQDGKGRVRTSKARREELLDEFERSSLTAPQFATLSGVKYQTLAVWIQKRKRERGKPSAATSSGDKVNWLEAVMAPASGNGSASGLPLRLQLPAGMSVEIVDARQAALAGVLVRELAKSC